MKTLPPLLFAAALATVLLAAPAAQAFTFENMGSSDGAASANALAPGVKPYLDPTDKSVPSQDTSRFDGNGTSKYEFGGTTLQFGHRRSFNQRFNPDYLYDPLRR